MQLLAHLADAYRALVVYDLGGAVGLFQKLPPQHWDTPWVLTQVGRAYFSAERFKKVYISFNFNLDLCVCVCLFLICGWLPNVGVFVSIIQMASA